MIYYPQCQIGTSAATLTMVEKLIATCPPRMTYVPWPTRYVGSDGLTYGDGTPVVTWTWDMATWDELNALRAYVSTNPSAAVYIQTQLDDGTYDLFTANMHWPETLYKQDRLAGFFRNIEVKFTNLVAV